VGDSEKWPWGNEYVGGECIEVVVKNEVDCEKFGGGFENWVKCGRVRGSSREMMECWEPWQSNVTQPV